VFSLTPSAANSPKTGTIIHSPAKVQKDALFLIDGREVNYNDISKYPNFKDVQFFPKESAVKLFGEKGKNGVYRLTTYNQTEVYTVVDRKEIPVNGKTPLYILDGKEIKIKKEDIKKLDPNKIESINVLKDKSAVEKYGEKGKNGVIEITTKKKE